MMIAIAEAQRISDNHRKTLKCTSPFIAKLLADLATIAVPAAEVRLFIQSLGGRVPLPSQVFDRYSERSYTKHIRIGSPEALADIKRSNLIHAERCGNDADWLAYPNDRPRSRERVEQMRLSEKRLDSIWSNFDDRIQKYKIHDPAEQVRSPADRQRTPPWSDEEERRPCRKQKVAQPTQNLEELYWNLHISTERTIDSTAKAQKSKAKLKTRGTGDQLRSSEEHSTFHSSSAPSVQAIAPNDGEAVEPSISQIEVNGRALKTFKALFFTPSPGATPGEVPWKDFLYAMYSAGFRAEKMYGSAWKFDPVETSIPEKTAPAISPTSSSHTTKTTAASAVVTTDELISTTRSSIIFHEPHPSNKIPYVIARRHGRRLARAYGWSGETFVLAEKEKAAPRNQKEKDKDKESE